MQTKQQIQYLLSSAGIRPNKRLGQHFLIDLNLMRLLVDSAHIKNSDIVLEVGCGTGSLTEALAAKAGLVIAVELDKTLAKIANRQLAGVKNVRVINGDILETKNAISRTITKAIYLRRKKYPGRLPGPKVLLVANLPYNVACPVMLNLITGPVTVDAMYVTVQQEVARRMTAPPGSKYYGSLSIFLTATGDVKTIRVLKPTVFWPRPQVNSAMITFIRRKAKAGRIHNMEFFSKLVKLFMQHRRKMLKTCAKSVTGKLTQIKDWPEIFEKCSIDPTQRSDQLSPESYIAIANSCHRYSCHRYSCHRYLCHRHLSVKQTTKSKVRIIQ